MFVVIRTIGRYRFAAFRYLTILRTIERGAKRTETAISWLRKPATATTRPRRNARCPICATASADMALRLKRREAWAFAATRKFVAVGPGHSAVTVKPVPANSSAKASLKDSTKALVA